ncbi:hypothetical protein ACFO7V_15120 [Glutamicibacter bergerei]|uniref:DUF1190 domain-containing protein n=1 Tax=Glutamicibacter bergerei TaxID=256702 RepID=A0ABV9MQZ3_9MICC|nr:hypothetical protein [Micrococcaceae bacterium]
MSVQRRFTLPAVATAAALVLSSCASDAGSNSGFESTPEDTVYCVDQDNVVVDEAQCNDAQGSSAHHGGSGIGTALMFFMIGRYAGGLRPGTRLDPTQSTQRFSTTDNAARTKAGLSGTFRNGYSASTGTPAGFGSSNKQRSGTGHSGGFGGGHTGG